MIWEMWNHQNLDNVEESLDRTIDMTSRTNIRRSRLRMLFEEFQNEIANLEDKLEKCSAENAKLKAVNEELRQQVDESNGFSMKMASDTLDGSKVNADSGDISTIIKLSNKLQEMVHVNENITRVNAALRRDLKSLSSEREVYLQDLIKLREENKFPHSPNPYSRYNVASMKEKIDNYEREIHQWKNDMKRADDHISELGKELETYKRATNNNNDQEFSCNDGTMNRGNSTPVSPVENRRKRIVPSSNSATEALQKLVSQKDPSTEDEQIPELYSENNTFKSPLIEIPNEIGQPISSPKETVLLEPDKLPGNNGDMFSDPVRFPACVKLLELTKARHGDESVSARTSPSNQTGRPFNPIPSPDNRNSLFWNNGMAFTNGNRTNGNSPAVHHRPVSNSDNRLNKGDMDDDITIVLPSSDHSLIQHTPDSDNQSRDMLFQSAHISETSFRSRIDQGLSPCSESNRPISRNGIGMGQNHSDYSYYPSSSYQEGHYLPLKKVKIEDSDK